MEQETLLLVFKFLHTLVIQYWIPSNRFGFGLMVSDILFSVFGDCDVTGMADGRTF